MVGMYYPVYMPLPVHLRVHHPATVLGDTAAAVTVRAGLTALRRGVTERNISGASLTVTRFTVGLLSPITRFTVGR